MKSRLTLHQKPIQWQRPVKTMWGTFNPHQKKLNFVRKLLKDLWLEKPQLEGPISVKLVFVMPIAKSLSKKKKALLDKQYHCKDPDIDNLQKFYLDALSGLVCHDDCQFAKVQAVKVYGSDAKVEIMLSALEIDDVNQEQLAILQEFAD